MIHRPVRRRPRPRLLAVAAAAALAATTLAVGTLAVGALTASTAAADPGFYTPPTNLPSRNGELIRTAPQPLGVSLALPIGNVQLPGRATKIMYRSTDETGSGVAVTGAYIEPAAPWSGSGPRPLVSFAEGTQGQGDGCAPSKTLESPLLVQPGQTALGYEVPSIYGFLARGVAVVATDYVGLGTTDRVHTYTTRVDMGNAVLDAARAAVRVPGASVTSASPVGLYGYSQGGGATAAAVELAPSYAPELQLKGAYAGAPPANLRAVLSSADGTALTGVIGYAINGLLQYRPALRAILDREINAAGRTALATVAGQCIGDTILSYGFQRTNAWTTSGQSAGTVVDRTPAAVQAIDAQRIGRRTPAVPVMVLTGTQDDIVQHAQAKQLAKDWCDRGANVTYTPVIQLLPSGGTALNHLTPAFLNAPQAQSWLIDRLSGRSTWSNCALLPFLP